MIPENYFVGHARMWYPKRTKLLCPPQNASLVIIPSEHYNRASYFVTWESLLYEPSCKIVVPGEPVLSVLKILSMLNRLKGLREPTGATHDALLSRGWKDPICEPWQAEKMAGKSVSPNDLLPMWADWKSKENSFCHYFINELAKLNSGDFVIPLRWITVDGVDHADALEVRFNPEV